MLSPCRRWAVALVLMAATGCAAPVSPDTAAPESEISGGSPRRPFHDFRSRPLEYPGPGRDEPEPAGLEEVAIGWFGPRDPDHELAGSMWLAAVLAVQEENEAGGFQGLPFRLVPGWTESPWATGASLVAGMAYRDRVWAIVGSIDGPTTHIAEQVVAKARLPLVSPVSTDPSVNLAGVPWMFSCAPADHLYADLLAASVLSHLGGREDVFAVLRSTDHDSRLAASEILKSFARRNRGPDRLLDFHPGTDDFSAHVQALGQLRPSAALVVAGPQDSARLALAIRATAPGCLLFGTPHMARTSFLRVAGEAAEGVRFPLYFEPTPSPFRRRFTAQAGVPPDYVAAYTYDAVRLVIAAIRRAGLNRARIRDALAELSPWRGVTGVIEWDATGQNTRPITGMAVIRAGRIRSEASPAAPPGSPVGAGDPE